ncbi:hypothetical protein QA646_29740 (plasmid) [Rhizobium sp. CB3090]|uniref:hypothetical protein n=1 Tax=Rhizobium sp. CB3090 TaxID=3039156 RepID=UPI0024B0853E|nr:hypothetical protein [Rhizobium sp. CB3090]WFU13387.1 hypothetical protein QA646_29740 [Rhizobium sp. CB3090]
MINREHNPLLALYGTPRAVVHSRVSARAKAMAPSCDQDDPEKIGNPVVSLTSLKDHKSESR